MGLNRSAEHLVLRETIAARLFLANRAYRRISRGSPTQADHVVTRLTPGGVLGLLEPPACQLPARHHRRTAPVTNTKRAIRHAAIDQSAGRRQLPVIVRVGDRVKGPPAVSAFYKGLCSRTSTCTLTDVLEYAADLRTAGVAGPKVLSLRGTVAES